MATGAGYYDAEGVWIYGENDHIALFSDLLNLGENSVSDQFTLDRSRITAVEASLGVRYAAASSTARDAHFGVPANDTQRLALQNSGAECVRTDLGYAEAYYATYNASTNPGGATPAGWYPAAGQSVTGGLIRNATAVTIATASSITLTSGFDIGFSTGVTVTAGSTPSITIPATGLYQVNSLLTWASGAGSTVRYLWVTKNTSANATPTAAQTVISYIVQPAGTSAVSLGGSMIVKLTAGDVLRLCVNQASGASLTLVDNASGSGVNQGLSIQWIGAQR
jgi:hypothetical protein